MKVVSDESPLEPGFDFTSPDLLERGIPVEEFAYLRRTAPVWWNAQLKTDSVFGDGGYWVVTKHEDIKAISRNSELWSTNLQGAIMRLPDGITSEQLELTKALLINHDPPAHTRLRKLVSRLFTPRAIAGLEDKLEQSARHIVAGAAQKKSGNFVDDIAMKLPLQAIADLIGVPKADRQKLFEWSNTMMNTDDPDYSSVDPAVANAELMAYAYNMAEERRRNPADDIVTRLIEADVDGDSLGDAEFAFFVILLAVAGNETTRNAMTHGMNAFFDNPEQWELYKRERPATAVEETTGGPPRCTVSSAQQRQTPTWAGSASSRASGSVCSIVRPTTTKPSSSGLSSSTSRAILTRTWASGVTAHTTVSALTSHAWRSS